MSAAIPEDFQTEEEIWFSVRKESQCIQASLTNIVVLCQWSRADSLENQSLQKKSYLNLTDMTFVLFR